MTSRVLIKFATEKAKEVYSNKPLIASTKFSCGYDVRACFSNIPIGNDINIGGGTRLLIPIGIQLEMQNNLGAFLYSRSGLGSKEGLAVAGGVCVIDPDYRGELSTILLNTTKHSLQIKNGQRIAQLVFKQIERPLFVITNDLTPSERGEGSYGSTGNK